MSDPNVYQGSGKGGTQVALCNIVAAFGVDNTGATDAGPAIQAALNSLVGASIASVAKQAAWFPRGTYKIATPITVPPNAVLFANPGTVTLNGTIVPDGNQKHAVLFAENSTGATTTLAANTVKGTRTMSLTGNGGGTIVPGTLISVATTPIRSQIFTVVSISGGGPYTVVVDRTIQEVYTSGGASTVVVVTNLPENILVDGLNFTGTATRFIEFIAARYCEVSNCNFFAGSLTALSDIVASFDVAGFRNTWRNCVVDCTGAGGALITSDCLALESQEQSAIIDCYVSSLTTTSTHGFGLYDCFDCSLEDSVAENCYVGAQIASDGNALGSSGTRVSNLRTYQTAFAGLYVFGASSDTTVVGSTLAYGANACLLTDPAVASLSVVGGQIGPATGAGDLVYVADGVGELSFVGVTLVGASTGSFGWHMYGAGSVTVSGCSVTGSIGRVLDVANAAADFDASGLDVSLTAVGVGLVNGSAGRVRIRGLNYAAPAGGQAVVQASGGRYTFSSCNVAASAATNGFETTGPAVISLSDVVGTCPGGFALVTVGGTVRVGSGCKFDGWANYYFNSGGFTNRGQTTAGSIGGVAVPWPDLTDDDVVILTPTAAVFTGWVSSLTPGTGFTVKDAAAGTYGYYIP